MEGRGKTALAEELAGALDWWRDAGIEYAFHDEPTRWISPAQPTAEEAARLRAELRDAPPPLRSPQSDRAPQLAGSAQSGQPRELRPDTAGWPNDLALFAEWWLSEPWLDDGRTGGRVPPRGARHARIMVLVPEPEREDRERLLSGAQGRLLQAMLAAMGTGEGEAYVASALPRHTPMPDWDDLSAKGIGQVLAHHVALAAPERLVAFGDGVLSLLRNNLTISNDGTGVFKHDGGSIALLGARSLEGLLARPGWKAEFWRRWLDWTHGASGEA